MRKERAGRPALFRFRGVVAPCGEACASAAPEPVAVSSPIFPARRLKSEGSRTSRRADARRSEWARRFSLREKRSALRAFLAYLEEAGRGLGEQVDQQSVEDGAAFLRRHQTIFGPGDQIGAFKRRNALFGDRRA